MKSAEERARKTMCLSNMNQICTAAYQYHLDNETFPWLQGVPALKDELAPYLGVGGFDPDPAGKKWQTVLYYTCTPTESPRLYQTRTYCPNG